MKSLLESRLNKYNSILLKEYKFDDEEDEFVPDFDDEDTEEENDDIKDIADNKFDKVIQDEKPKKHIEPEENAPAPGVNTEYRTFNKKGNTTAVDTSDIFSDEDDLFDTSDVDLSDDEDEEDEFKPDWDWEEDEKPKKEKKKPAEEPQPKKPVKIDKSKISLEDELMNDEDGIEYSKPTISLKMFQKAVDKFKVTGSEFRNPYYNELFSQAIPGVHMDKNGRIYISVSFRTPEDIENDKYGSGLLIRKNTLAEVFTCLYIVLNSVDERVGSIFIGDYADQYDYFVEYILEADDDEMEIVDEFIRKLIKVKLMNLYEIKAFTDWYDAKKDEYSAKYFDKEPDKKKVRHSKIRDTRQLFREFDLKKDRMKSGNNGKYIDIMGNILHALDYNPQKCSEYKPPRNMKAVDLVKLYVAGLILMQKRIPKTEDEIKDMPVFQYFAKAALRQGVEWKDIVKLYNSY